MIPKTVQKIWSRVKQGKRPVFIASGSRELSAVQWMIDNGYPIDSMRRVVGKRGRQFAYVKIKADWWKTFTANRREQELKNSPGDVFDLIAKQVGKQFKLTNE